MDEILASFLGQWSSFPLTYLGLSIVLGRLRLLYLQPIQDKACANYSTQVANGCWTTGLLAPYNQTTEAIHQGF
jgi:hypothetical protein